MGFEDATRSSSEPEPKADAPVAQLPTTDAAQAKKEKERAEEAARGRLRRAQAKLKEAKDEGSLKKLAAELAGTPPPGAVVKLAPTVTPEKLAELLHNALKPNAPLLALAAQGSEDTWADACRALSTALDGPQGKALCEGWAPLLCQLFPNGLDNPYAAAIVSTLVFSLGVGVQTALVRIQRVDAKKAST